MITLWNLVYKMVHDGLQLKKDVKNLAILVVTYGNFCCLHRPLQQLWHHRASNGKSDKLYHNEIFCSQLSLSYCVLHPHSTSVRAIFLSSGRFSSSLNSFLLDFLQETITECEVQQVDSTNSLLKHSIALCLTFQQLMKMQGHLVSYNSMFSIKQITMCLMSDHQKPVKNLRFNVVSKYIMWPKLLNWWSNAMIGRLITSYLAVIFGHPSWNHVHKGSNKSS